MDPCIKGYIYKTFPYIRSQRTVWKRWKKDIKVQRIRKKKYKKQNIY